MRTLFGLLFLTFLFSSCNDGKMDFKSFNFETSTTISSCTTNNNLYFKINSSEALILKTPLTSFVNEVTPVGTPRTVLISGDTQLLYRTFDNILSSDYFCGSIPPASPKVVDEWIAKSGVSNVSGFLEITTTAIVNATTQAITGYNHYVVFRNVTFLNSKSSFTYDNYIFGNYTTGL